MLEDLQNDNSEQEDLPSDVRPMTKEEILAAVQAEEANAKSWGEEIAGSRQTAVITTMAVRWAMRKTRI